MSTLQNDSAPVRLVFLHGFEPAEALAILRAAKAAVEDPENVAASMSTPTNMDWKVGDLVAHVSEEHAWFREHGSPKPD
ncbi:MAG: DUF3783 domain-containing protein [Spirochaetales bacterium]|nr:DUF3783 domain-containing protein [Spirochaetales bacterium]